jgi:hypothetical protein
MDAGPFFVIYFLGLPELWHKDKTKAQTCFYGRSERRSGRLSRFVTEL